MLPTTRPQWSPESALTVTWAASSGRCPQATSAAGGWCHHERALRGGHLGNPRWFRQADGDGGTLPWEQSGWCSTQGYAAAGGPGWPSRSSSASSAASCWPPRPPAGGRERVPALRGGPRVRQHRLRHQTGAGGRPSARGGLGHRARLRRRGQSDLRLRTPDQPQQLRRGRRVGPGRSPFTLVSGQLPDPSKPDQVLASSTLQQDSGVHVGTVIHVPFEAPSQAADYNNPNTGLPDPHGPHLALQVVGIEASEVEFPSGATPVYLLYAGPGFAALGAPAHGVAIPVLRPPAPRCGRHPPVRPTGQPTEPGHGQRRRLERGRNRRHDPGVHPPAGRRVVDPRRARRARRAGGRGPGPGPPERRRERGPSDAGRRRHVRPGALRTRHGTEPGGGPGRRRGRGPDRHCVVPHRAPR